MRLSGPNGIVFDEKAISDGSALRGEAAVKLSDAHSVRHHASRPGDLHPQCVMTVAHRLPARIGRMVQTFARVIAAALYG